MTAASARAALVAWAGNLRGLFLPASCLWVKWLEVSLSPFLPLFPLSRSLGHEAPDNTWKALSAQECPPAWLAGLLHADGWQPAPGDKLIRTNLSMAGSDMRCLRFPSRCLSEAPLQEPQALPGSSVGPSPDGHSWRQWWSKPPPKQGVRAARLGSYPFARQPSGPTPGSLSTPGSCPSCQEGTWASKGTVYPP